MPKSLLVTLLVPVVCFLVLEPCREVDMASTQVTGALPDSITALTKLTYVARSKQLLHPAQSLREQCACAALALDNLFRRRPTLFFGILMARGGVVVIGQ